MASYFNVEFSGKSCNTPVTIKCSFRKLTTLPIASSSPNNFFAVDWVRTMELIFGKSVLEQGLYGNAKQPTLLSQWLGEQNGPFYRFVGTGVIPELSNCSNVTPQEAVKVSQSIRYLN